jgi:DNA-binding transcriptional LysR family regulator
MHLNPESLSFALLISDLGSIARAANILGMKQATLSRKLTALESRVGVRLFDRSTRGAVPTVSGAGFLNQARRIVSDLQGRRELVNGIWRREWDSNPRYGFPHTRFPSVRLKPLGHLSGCPLLKCHGDFCK